MYRTRLHVTVDPCFHLMSDVGEVYPDLTLVLFKNCDLAVNDAVCHVPFVPSIVTSAYMQLPVAR